MSDTQEPRVIINPVPVQVAARVEQVPSVVQPVNDTIIVIPDGYKDMSHPMSYLGTNPVKIWELTPIELTLADTTYSAWEASTTASAVWSVADPITSILITPIEHDYVIEWRTVVNVAYNDGATLKACPITWAGLHHHNIFRYSSSLANIKADNLNSTTYLNLRSLGMIEYYNANSVETWNATTYGIYTTIVTPTFTSATSTTPTLNIKLPTVTARCHATYFAVARKSEVNLANTHIRIEGALYQFDANSGFERRARKELTEFWKPHLT